MVRRSRKLLLLVGLATAALLLAACGDGSEQAEEGAADTDADVEEGAADTDTDVIEPAVGDDFHIGLIQPLTGPAGLVGEDIRDGLTLAIDEINNAGGVEALGGAQMTMTVGNSEGVNETTQLVAERMVESEEVSALVGAFISGNTLVLSEFAEEKQVPLVVPNPVAQSLREPERTFTFALSPGSTILAQAQGDFVRDVTESLGNTPRTAIVWEDTAWGTETSEAQRPAFDEAGVDLVADLAITSGGADLGPIASRAVAPDTELLITTIYPNDNINLLRALAAQGVMTEVNFMGVAGALVVPGVMELGDEVTDDLLAITWWSPDLQKPGVEELSERYETEFNKPLNENSAHAYAAGWILKEAAEIAGSTDRQALKAALDNLELPEDHPAMPAMSVQGGRFDEVGQFTAQPIIVQHQDNNWLTIWPKELATGEVNWKD